MSNLPASTLDSIDYIRYTLPYQVTVVGALPLLSDLKNDASSQIYEHAYFGYTKQRKLPSGIIVMWNPDNENMGICVQAGGQAIRALEAEITSAWTLIRWADENGARFKRIDYAIDLKGDRALPPSAIADAISAGQIAFKGKQWQWVEKNPQNATKRAIAGSTIYLGSRASDRFVRYYDKAAQQKIMGLSWARLEIELKDRRAQQYAQNCIDGDWMGYGRGQIFDYLHPTDQQTEIYQWCEQIRQELPTKSPAQIERLPSKPDAFVEKIVLPFLRRHGENVSDKNLLAMRSLITGELSAREWFERQHDSGLDSY